MNSLIYPLQLIWQRRSLVLQTTRSDILARYAGSALGLIWVVLYPLLFLSVYAVIYITVFKVRFNLFNTNEYVALIFCGLLPFLGFSEALGMGVSSVSGSANLIKNTLFPIELIPVKVVFVSQPTQIVGTVLLLLVLGFWGRLSVWTLLVPVIWILQIMFTIGLLWILSSLNVFLRDIQNVVSVVILMLMMISPIAYTADMVPEGLRGFLAFNPLYYLIIAYQDVMMLGQYPANGNLEIFSAIAICFFFVGFWFFSRMKRVFADNV